MPKLDPYATWNRTTIVNNMWRTWLSMLSSRTNERFSRKTCLVNYIKILSFDNSTNRKTCSSERVKRISDCDHKFPLLSLDGVKINVTSLVWFEKPRGTVPIFWSNNDVIPETPLGNVREFGPSDHAILSEFWSKNTHIKCNLPHMIWNMHANMILPTDL